jgi:hypothetical protein
MTGQSGDGPGGEQASMLRRFAGPAVIVLAALVATAPQLVRGNSCGHDFDFHLVSWLDAAQSWREGIAYPHWSPSANYGAGEPRFVFYPPVTWMLGAALGLVLPWKIVPIALTFLVLAGAGLATRALAREALADGPATLAGCAALFSGYALFTAYERSDFGELTGGFWIPLLLLFTLRDRRREGGVVRRALDGSTVPLAVAVAGAWLSNPPLGVMTSYLLAAVALTVALLLRSWAPVLRASIALGAGLALTAIYLMPAAVEQPWVNIREAVSDPGYLIENNWLFAHHANPLLAYHDVELDRVSWIATTMIAVALAGIAMCRARRRMPGGRAWWIPLALIPAAVLFLQLPPSDLLWRALPKMVFLQFPWRWLVAAQAPMGIFLASALWAERRVWRIASLAACGIAFVAATLIAGLNFFQPCDEEDNVGAMLDVYRTGAGFEGSDEYTPPYANNPALAMSLPMACLTSSAETPLGRGTPGIDLEWAADQGTCDATFPAATGGKTSAEHLRVTADLPHPGFLILRLRSYPAWQVRLNGKPVESLPQRADGLITVTVPEGRADVTADWVTTRDALAGRWLSTIALVLLGCLFALERRLTKGRVS